MGWMNACLLILYPNTDCINTGSRQELMTNPKISFEVCFNAIIVQLYFKYIRMVIHSLVMSTIFLDVWWENLHSPKWLMITNSHISIHSSNSPQNVIIDQYYAEHNIEVLPTNNDFQAETRPSSVPVPNTQIHSSDWIRICDQIFNVGSQKQITI